MKEVRKVKKETEFKFFFFFFRVYLFYLQNRFLFYIFNDKIFTLINNLFRFSLNIFRLYEFFKIKMLVGKIFIYSFYTFNEEDLTLNLFVVVKSIDKTI